MEKKKLRIGSVGVGGMGTVHLMEYKKFPCVEKFEIVAICDIVPGRAEEKAEKSGWTDAHCYTDYKEMIEKEELDAIDISTPNYLHSIIAVYALDHGLHVICEKPDAVSVEEALKMKEASERNNKVLMVIRNNRWHWLSKGFKKEIEDGALGEIYAGRCGWIRRRGIPGRGGWFTTKEQSGGGPLIDLGVHMIDLAMWLMGNPTPVAVSGCVFNKFADNTASADSHHSFFGEAKADGTFDVEDLAMGFIRFDNGSCLQIEFSWASNIEKEQQFVELRGTKGGIAWPASGSIFTEDENGNLIDRPTWTEQSPEGHQANLSHFYDVIVDGATPNFVPQQGVNMIKILRAIYESAETGKEVLL